MEPGMIPGMEAWRHRAHSSRQVPRMTHYSVVATAWAIVFAFVALLFATLPDRVGSFLTKLAGFLGLGGRIESPGDTLWWVLALSLMVSVTGLAWHTARTPEAIGPYRILLAAKVTSTVGFAWLAWTAKAPVWLLCAAGDGFVAITLWLARRWSTSDPGSGGRVADAFGRVYRGQRPFYEVWFGKVDIGPGQAFWFRYTLLDGSTREAGTWAIAFDRERGIVAARETLPLDAATGGRPLVFQLGQNVLDAGRAIGHAGDLDWDLTFEAAMERMHDHVPWTLKALGLARTRYVSPFGDLRLSGTIRIGERLIQVEAAPGMIGHIHGARSGHSWAWAHCNTFRDRPDVVFEGLSARIALGSLVSPPLSSFVLWVGDRPYRFTSALGMLRARSRYGEGRWEFRAEAGGVVLEGEATAPPDDQVALVTYTDTDGSRLWCRNSKLADLRLRLIEPDRPIQEFVASGTAAFELVDRHPPSGPVHI